MFRRLRNRLLLLNMTIISLVMITAFAVIYFITYSNIQKENRSKLEAVPTMRVTTGSPDTQETQPSLYGFRVLIGVPIDYSQSFAILVDKSGQVVDVLSYIDMPPEAYAQLVQQIWGAGKDEGTLLYQDKKWQYLISSYRRLIQINGDQQVVHGDSYYKIAFLDITDSSKTLTQLLLTFFLVGAAMLFVLFGVSLHFANRSIGPIEDNWLKQKQFVADASHELKTPLAIISANADALLANGGETVDSQKKWIEYIQSEVRRIGKLVNDLLYLAKVENASEEQLPFDLSNTVLDVVASMEAVLFEKGISLTQEIESGLVVKGDQEQIKQAVLILLDNATKYTNIGGSVAITLAKNRNNAVFSVTNSGTGIPADKLPKVFDRFYRCDPSRSQETGGYGLGLSIAKAIIDRSGGSITAESSEDFTTFTFMLKTE